MDRFGNLGDSVFIVHTLDGRGQAVPMEMLATYAKEFPPAQAAELLNLVRQYRAERAGIRGRA